MHTFKERTISDVILQELFTLFCETWSLTGLELANSLGCLVGEPQGSAYLHCSSTWITSTCHRVPFFFKIEDIWSSQVLTLAREALYLSQTMCPAQALESRSGLFRGRLFVLLSGDLRFLESIEVNILIVSVCECVVYVYYIWYTCMTECVCVSLCVWYMYMNVWYMSVCICVLCMCDICALNVCGVCVVFVWCVCYM